MTRDAILLFVIILIISLQIVSSDSWIGYVKTTGDYWSIYRHSDNMSFELEQHVQGDIESFPGPRGRVLTPYGSYFENIDLNAVRLRQRTAALQGNYSSEAMISSKSEVKPPVVLDFSMSEKTGIYTIDYAENWPVRISASKRLMYSGRRINNRDFSANNHDFVGANLQFNTELSKDLDVEINLSRMNTTVLATEDRIILAESKPTSDLRFRLSANTTGISDIKFQQSASESYGSPGTNCAIVQGDERYWGQFNITTNIRLRSQFIKAKQENEWLPCCHQGWTDESADRRTPSAEEIFGCACAGMEGG